MNETGSVSAGNAFFGGGGDDGKYALYHDTRKYTLTWRHKACDHYLPCQQAVW